MYRQDNHDNMVATKPGRGVWLALFYSALLFAAAWCVWGLCTPLLGDDLMDVFKFRDFDNMPLVAELRYSWGIYVTTNARTGDMMAPMWMYVLPRWLSPLLLGAGVFGCFWGVMRLSGARSRKPLASALVMAGIYAALPWHDMLFWVCHFNYVWGAALCSLVLIALLEKRLVGRRWLWCVPAVFVAVATHEALGFPLGVGLAAWWFVNRHGGVRLNKVEKWWIGAMLAGALFSVSSQASYMRVGQQGAAGLSSVELVQTLPLVLLLALRVAWLAVRGGLRGLGHTRWLIFASAAGVSTLFTLAGGVEGRGGWYAEMFALMALGYDLTHRCEWLRLNTRGARRAAMAVALACNVAVICGGLRLMEYSCEARRLVEAYRVMPDLIMPVTAMPAVDMPYVRSTLPLTVGQGVDSPFCKYTPKPMREGEKNPADPAVSL